MRSCSARYGLPVGVYGCAHRLARACAIRSWIVIDPTCGSLMRQPAPTLPAATLLFIATNCADSMYAMFTALAACSHALYWSMFANVTYWPWPLTRQRLG